MAWPNAGNYSTTHLDEGTDDPSLARASILQALVDLQGVIGAKGSASGVASLDGSALVPVSQLPVVPVSKGGTGGATQFAARAGIGALGAKWTATSTVDANTANLINVGSLTALAIDPPPTAYLFITATQVTTGSISSADTFTNQVRSHPTYNPDILDIGADTDTIRLIPLTSNGFVKTSGDTGTLSIDTSTYLKADGSVAMSGNFNLDGYDLENVGTISFDPNGNGTVNALVVTANAIVAPKALTDSGFTILNAAGNATGNLYCAVIGGAATGATGVQLGVTGQSQPVTVDYRLGVGTAPSTKFHVADGTIVEPTWNAVDKMVLESNGSAVFQILTPNTSQGYFAFSDPEGRSRGYFGYAHVTDTMTIATAGVTALTLASNQAATFASTVQAAGYKSSDGTAGETATITIGSNTITVKNGIITAHT